MAMDRAYDVIDVMERIGANKGVSVAKDCADMALHQPHGASVIIGAKTVAQLDDSFGARKVTLSADEVAELEAVSGRSRIPCLDAANARGRGKATPQQTD